MPYNSSAFEKQLQKYKNEAAKKTASTDDAHVAKPQVVIGRGEVQPNIDLKATPTNAPITTEITPDAPPTELISKPFYKQGWFLFLLFSAATAMAIPAAMKTNMDGLMDMANMVKSSPAVATSTQKPATAPQKSSKREPMADIAEKPSPVLKSEKIKTVVKETLSNRNIQMQTTSDLHSMVEKAAAQAAEVSAQGPEQSMQYIEEQTRQLQNMAKQFDETYGVKKQ